MGFSLDEELYLKLNGDRYVHMFWSDNPPADKETAEGVLSINAYDKNHNLINGGELDIQEKLQELENYVEEGLDFIDIEYTDYEIISEEEFNA